MNEYHVCLATFCMNEIVLYIFEMNTLLISRCWHPQAIMPLGFIMLNKLTCCVTLVCSIQWPNYLVFSVS